MRVCHCCHCCHCHLLQSYTCARQRAVVLIAIPVLSPPPPRRVRFGEKHKSLTPHTTRTVSAILYTDNHSPQLSPVRRHCHHHHPHLLARVFLTMELGLRKSRWTRISAEYGAREEGYIDAFRLRPRSCAGECRTGTGFGTTLLPRPLGLHVAG